MLFAVSFYRVIVSKQCHKSEQCSSSASESVLLCSGQGKAAVVTGMGLPHKEQHYNLEDVHKNWDKQTSTPQLRYDLNQKTRQIEC